MAEDQEYEIEDSQVEVKEFEPLTHLLKFLPDKLPKGLSAVPIEITCIDVRQEYIAIGTDHGIVFMYDRERQTFGKLSLKSKYEIVTCVRMQYSVDFVVAVGTASGFLTIFQLPSSLPGRNKQLQQFRVEGMHENSVTCVEWSQNAMKLFTGDREGIVVCTELDYAENQSKSYKVCQEFHEIVQLNYAYKTLLVSTKRRSLIVLTDENNRPSQVGTKERKCLGTFGATFMPEMCRPEDATLYAVRPGLRLWRANIQGVVQSTYIFRDLLNEKTQLLETLSDTPVVKKQLIEERQFGYIRPYLQRFLITWCENGLYILNPTSGGFIGWHGSLGKIQDVAIWQDEIYVLRQGNGRRILRFATRPDPITTISTMDLPPPENSVSPAHILQQTANRMSSLVGAFKEVGNKLQSSVHDNSKPKETDPPWGSVFKRKGAQTAEGNSPEVETAKEASSSTTVSPDMPNARQLAGAKNVPESELNSEQILSVRMSNGEGSKNITDSMEVFMGSCNQSEATTRPYSLSSFASAFQDEENSKKKLWAIDEPIGDDGGKEIVFKAKPKKGKRKKKKGDKDTDSINSFELDTVGDADGLERSVSNSPSPLVQDSTSPKFQTTPGLERNVSHSPSPLVQDSTPPKFQTTPAEERSAISKSYKAESQDKELLAKKEEDEEKDNVITYNSVMTTKNIEPLSVETENKPSVDVVTTDNVVEKEVKKPTTEIIKESKRDPPQGEAVKIASETLKKSKSIEDTTTKPATNATSQSPKTSPTKVIPKVDPLEVEFGYVKQPGAKSEKNKNTRSDSIGEDFYSMYNSYSSEPTISDIVATQSAAKDQLSAAQSKLESSGERLNIENTTDPRLQLEFTDNWIDCLFPTSCQSICVSKHHIWSTDKSEKIYWSSLGGSKLKWNKISESGRDVSVSPSGGIVWRLHNNSAFAGTNITTRNPAGLKWVEAAREVDFICVDDTVAWYVKKNAEILMQKGLSRERPCYKPIKVASKRTLTQISCRSNVVWGITVSGTVVIRSGVTDSKPEGKEWKDLEGDDVPIAATIAIGNENTAWILDAVGRLWFTTDVTPQNPHGSGIWWQIAMSDYLMHDTTAISRVKSLKSNVKRNITKFLAGQPLPLITGGVNGIWAGLQGLNRVSLCKVSLLGHKWDVATPQGMAVTTKWADVCANAVTQGENGWIWAQQHNGSIFCFNSKSNKVTEVAGPDLMNPFKSLCTNTEVLWGLTSKGEVFIRTGMGPHCVQGVKWMQLDLTQLGNVSMISLSCGTQNVWAVDETGMVYLRIGTKAPSAHHLNPAWVPVEGTTQFMGGRFTSVVTGPQDWMVWAIDNKKNVYVRKGVTDAMPIGTHWVYVTGTNAKWLCMSENLVFALNENGEVLVRYGITPERCAGEYWKKIPGAFKSLSATMCGELWGINFDGQLCQRSTNFLQRKEVLKDFKGVGVDVDEEWEMI